MTIWFTADQHFGHENIIEYCNRPFPRLGKMEQAIIGNYRKVVAPEDTVYILGDLTIKGPQHRGHLEYILEQLPGNKHLILGNHDKFDPFVYVELGVLTVHTALDIGDYILIHDPVLCHAVNNRKWLCGHVHTLFKMNTHGNVLNVGVDQWCFFPVNIDYVNMMFDETVVRRETRKVWEEQ